MPKAQLQTKELRALPDADMQDQLVKLRQELWQLRVKQTDGSMQQTHQLRIIRRQMARMHTILRERQ